MNDEDLFLYSIDDIGFQFQATVPGLTTTACMP